MPLSRVFRIDDTYQLKALRFVDFAEQDAGGENGGSPFVQESMVARAPVVETPRGEDSGGAAAAQGISEEQLAEAYQRGREEALAEAGANLVSAADALGEALREISRLREGTLRRSTEDMVRLVMVIAEQVIGAEIATRPEFVLETLKQAMHHALKTDEYQVRVHPDDLAVVTDNKPLFMAAVSGLKNIRLETDPAITRGGCVVESQLGQVDATLDSRLEEIRRSLLAHLEES
jgi:flagellar assembly protein FliH